MADKYAALKNNPPYQRPRKVAPARPTNTPEFQLKTEEELETLRARIRDNKEKGKKPAKQAKVVTIKFHLGIQEHDLGIKHDKIREELHDGNQVKIMLVLQGRERSRPHNGVVWLNQQAAVHEEYSAMNKPATVENLSIILFPALHKPKNKGTGAQQTPTQQNKEQ